MKHLITVSAALLFAVAGISQQVISSSGDVYSNDEGIIGFTLGEMIISTESDDGNALTQGFHQTAWGSVGVRNIYSNVNQFSVYPNPFTNQLNIRMEHSEMVDYQISDAKGIVVERGQINSKLTTIDLSNLRPGNYAVSVYNDEEFSTLMIIKTH